METTDNKYIYVSFWIPFLWYFFATSRNIGDWFSSNVNISNELLYEEGSPYDRLFYSLLISIGIIILIKRRVEFFEIARKNKLYFLFILYLLVSILWSKFPYISFKRWIKLVGSLIVIFVIKTEKNDYKSFLAILRSVFFIHLPLSLILIKYFRTYGVGWEKDGSAVMWQGVSTHKNTFGQLLMMSNLYFIYELFINRKTTSSNNKLNNDYSDRYKYYIYYLYLILGIYLMMFGEGHSKSSTAILTLIIGIMIMFKLSYMHNFKEEYKRIIFKNVLIGACLIIAINLFTLTVFDKSVYELTLQVEGKDETLTGRSELWTDILQIANKNPMLGVGYGSFWIGNISNNLWVKHTWGPQQAHNGYIDVYVETGIIGIIFIIAIIILAYQDVFKLANINKNHFILIFTILTMILIHNYTESSYLRATHSLWFLFLYCTIRNKHIEKN